jgi:alpha-1,2-mannosyltransferase
MVNSSWTAAHVRQVWWMWDEPALVYPPCDTTDLQSLPLDRRLKHLFLVSVAQFRPEKNHRLQLEAYAMAREQAGTQVQVLCWCLFSSGVYFKAELLSRVYLPVALEVWT